MIAGIDSGLVTAVVQQDPKQEGVEAVNELAGILDGDEPQGFIDVPITIVTEDERRRLPRHLRVSWSLAGKVDADADDTRGGRRRAPGPRRDARRSARASGRSTCCKGSTSRSRPARSIGLVGDNGAGKSTLMKMLAGAVTPDARRASSSTARS